MKIKNLKVNAYGNIENKDINLGEGINIIHGENESGKSTLLNYIVSSFYGISRNKDGKALSDFEKYKPWNSTEFSGRIEYQLDNGEKYEKGCSIWDVTAGIRTWCSIRSGRAASRTATATAWATYRACTKSWTISKVWAWTASGSRRCIPHRGRTAGTISPITGTSRRSSAAWNGSKRCWRAPISGA